MKSKKIIALIVFVIVLIILAVLITFSMSNSDKEENLKEINTSNLKESNMIENDNMEKTSETNNEQAISSEGSENMNSQSEEIKVNLIVNNKTFTATLNNNETTRELVSMFPMTLNMSDLHSNEKYNYLDTNLPTNSNRSNRINAGDIKLFGSDCLVVFYESFSNVYSYTDLGKVDDVDAFVSELGRGSINIRFELVN